MSESHPSSSSGNPWYAQGLRFHCTGCGVCCSGRGRVWLNEQDIEGLSIALKIESHELVAHFVERIEGRWALKEDPHSGDCTFLKDRQCQVYTGRPRQCRTFPWWPSTLKSPERWEEAARICEGINATEAPIVPLIHIEEALNTERKGRRTP